MRRETHGNAMQILAQAQIQAKRDAERQQFLVNKEFVSAQLAYVIELAPPIYKGQKRPTKLELLKHIEKPAGYTVEKRR